MYLVPNTAGTGLNPNRDRLVVVFNFQKIITRSIFVTDKKITWNIIIKFHFLSKKITPPLKKKKKIGVQTSKNRNSKNINRKQKFYF